MNNEKDLYAVVVDGQLQAEIEGTALSYDNEARNTKILNNGVIVAVAPAHALVYKKST